MSKLLYFFLLIFFSLLTFSKKVRGFIDEKIESYVYYPYFFAYNEIHSFFYIRSKKLEGLKFKLKKEEVPLFVSFPVYYDEFPYPKILILKGEGKKGDVVVTENALVGKVIEVKKNFLKVKTVFNEEFKCSLISKYNLLSIYQGTGGRFGIVNFYPTWGEIKKGDTLYTSGITENFPKGIPAFIVDSIIKKRSDIFFELYVSPLWKPEKYCLYYVVPPSR
ncbi:MAG: rod shape-determining protein MreC [Candidatus Hydrothermales bacterium]